MNTEFDKLKQSIEQLNVANDEKKAMLQLLGKIE